MNTGVRGRSEVAPMPPPPSPPPPPADGEGSSEDPQRCLSPGLPPSYAEALQHRTVEYGGYDMFYTGPPPPLPANYHLGPDPNRIDRLPPERHPSQASVDDDTERCMKMTLPPMHMCMAVTCLVFNFLIPGSGTMLAAFGVFCCTKRNEWTVKRKFGACCLNFTIGLAQLILTPLLLLGWIWSILWGFAFVGVSSEAYHGRKLTSRQEPEENPHRPLTATPRIGQPGISPRPGPSGMPPPPPPPPPGQDQIQVTPVIHVAADLGSTDNTNTNTTQSPDSTPAATEPQPTQPAGQEPEVIIVRDSSADNHSSVSQATAET